MDIKIANAPVSYGIYSPNEPPVGADDLLAAFATAGYEGTDTGPLDYLGTGEELAERLARHNQGLAGGWVDLRYGRPEFDADLSDLDAALNTLSSVQVTDDRFAPRPTLACPADPFRFAAPGLGPHPDTNPAPNSRKTSKEWAAFAGDVQRAANRCREHGLEPVFHHHLGTVVETPEETRRLFDMTDISLCLDTGHWWLAGGDPVAAVHEFGDRIRQVHLKDASREAHARARRAGGDLWAVVAAGGFAALGEGDIDFATFLGALREKDYEGWLVVEQDAPPGQDADGVTSIAADQRANREFLRRAGL